jgi:hypothetical protein
MNSAVSMGRVSPNETVFIWRASLKWRAAVSSLGISMVFEEAGVVDFNEKVLNRRKATKMIAATRNIFMSILFL